MIATQYIKSTTQIPVEYENYETINVLKWNNSKYKELCPYYLKTDGNESAKNNGGILFENFYQGLKLYPRIYSQKIYPSQYQKNNIKYLSWQWETKNKDGDELYDEENDKINYDEYFAWRDSIWACTKPLRYPNGFHARKSVKFALIIDKNSVEYRMDYEQLRREIYIKEYIRLIRTLPVYNKLLEKINTGKCLMICEVDVPANGKPGNYGKHCDENNVTSISKKKLEKLMTDTSAPFGHGLALAYALLMDKQES